MIDDAEKVLLVYIPQISRCCLQYQSKLITHRPKSCLHFDLMLWF